VKRASVAGRAYDVAMGLVFDKRVPPTPDHYCLGAEHEFLSIAPGDDSDPAVTREVLNAALVSLNRPRSAARRAGGLR
jgi:hypothetical protein